MVLLKTFWHHSREHKITANDQAFNKEMSKVRIAVEWGFGKITQYFAYLDVKKTKKILLQPVGKYYTVACVLINCHTCLYGSLTSKYFGLNPPSLETLYNRNWKICNLFIQKI